MDIPADYLEKFKVIYPKSLFPPSASELRYYILKNRCPICLRRLYWKADLSLGYCKSKRKDGFVITRETYSRLGGM